MLLTLQNFSFSIFNVYRPPRENLQNYLESLQTAIYSIQGEKIIADRHPGMID